MIGREALIPNPAMQLFAGLLGTWSTTGIHHLLPGKTFHGRASFEWAEGGAFMILRSEIDEKEIPSGIAIFGSDDLTEEYYMLYFDERGVSRKYDARMRGNVLKWWRMAPDMSQRYTLTISDDGRTMVGKGEMSRDGTTWNGDLDLTYTRSGP